MIYHSNFNDLDDKYLRNNLFFPRILTNYTNKLNLICELYLKKYILNVIIIREYYNYRLIILTHSYLVRKNIENIID